MKAPKVLPGNYSIYNQYVVRVADRDRVKQELSKRGISTAVYYPIPLHRQECLAYLGYGEGDFPVSEEACRAVLALPLYPELAAELQERVVRSCVSFVRQRARRAA